MKRSAPLKRSAWPSRAQPAGEQRPERIKPVAQPLARPPVYWKPANEPVLAAPKEELLSSTAYRRAVAGLPCIACGIVGYSQHAHANEGKGAGLKTDDRTGFPLCCTRPGVEGCHVAFDQYRLLAGGRDAHRAAARAWGEQTRATVLALGLWPKTLPNWKQGEPTQ